MSNRASIWHWCTAYFLQIPLRFESEALKLKHCRHLKLDTKTCRLHPFFSPFVSLKGFRNRFVTCWQITPQCFSGMCIAKTLRTSLKNAIASCNNSGHHIQESKDIHDKEQRKCFCWSPEFSSELCSLPFMAGPLSQPWLCKSPSEIPHFLLLLKDYFCQFSDSQICHIHKWNVLWS